MANAKTIMEVCQIPSDEMARRLLEENNGDENASIMAFFDLAPHMQAHYQSNDGALTRDAPARAKPGEAPSKKPRLDEPAEPVVAPVPAPAAAPVAAPVPVANAAPAAALPRPAPLNKSVAGAALAVGGAPKLSPSKMGASARKSTGSIGPRAAVAVRGGGGAAQAKPNGLGVHAVGKDKEEEADVKAPPPQAVTEKARSAEVAIEKQNEAEEAGGKRDGDGEELKPMLIESLYDRLDTAEGVFIGEVMIVENKRLTNGLQPLGEAAPIADWTGLVANESQSEAAEVTRTALAAGLVSCTLTPVMARLHVVRVYYLKTNMFRGLAADKLYMALHLAQVFRRNVREC